MQNQSKEKEHRSLGEHNGILSSQINMARVIMTGKGNKIRAGKLLEEEEEEKRKEQKQQ